MFLNVPETYMLLVVKTIAFLQYCARETTADYCVKVDDDTYFRARAGADWFFSHQKNTAGGHLRRRDNLSYLGREWVVDSKKNLTM